jgi:hypothetical protein
MIYRIINLFKKKKPYFNKEKYLLDETITKDTVLLNLLNNNPNWFDRIENKPLVQISRDYFKLKNNEIEEFFWIEKSWITWR